MYNIGKMRDRINLLEKVEVEPIDALGNSADFRLVHLNLSAQKIKRMDRESIILKATHNQTRVDFIIRTVPLHCDQVIECNGERFNILGFEELKDNPRFTLIAALLMR